MQVTLSLPHRIALRALAMWYYKKQHPDLRPPAMLPQDGLQALAELVPRGTCVVPHRPPEGRPIGSDKVLFGVVVKVRNKKAGLALCGMASAMGLRSPQDAVREIADRILTAAPDVEIGTMETIDMAAIDSVIVAMRTTCLEAPRCER